MGYKIQRVVVNTVNYILPTMQSLFAVVFYSILLWQGVVFVE